VLDTKDAAIKCRFCGEYFKKQENVLNKELSKENNSK